jgi:hypothetical protein
MVLSFQHFFFKEPEWPVPGFGNTEKTETHGSSKIQITVQHQPMVLPKFK